MPPQCACRVPHSRARLSCRLCLLILVEKGKGNDPNLMDDETGLVRLSGMTMVMQLFTLRTRTETGSSDFMAHLFLLPVASQPLMLKGTEVDEWQVLCLHVTDMK